MSEIYRVGDDVYKPHVTDRSIGLAKVNRDGELFDEHYGGIEWLVSSWLAETVEETVKEVAKMLPLFFEPSVIEQIKEDFRVELSKPRSHD